jgi:hypothetical protein
LPWFLLCNGTYAREVIIRCVGIFVDGLRRVEYRNGKLLGLYVVRKIAYGKLEVFKLRIALQKHSIKKRLVVTQVDNGGIGAEGR